MNRSNLTIEIYTFRFYHQRDISIRYISFIIKEVYITNRNPVSSNGFASTTYFPDIKIQKPFVYNFDNRLMYFEFKPIEKTDSMFCK